MEHKDFFEAGSLTEPLDKETWRALIATLHDYFSDVTVVDNEISVRGNGVTSTFTLDPATHKLILNPERSHDLFENDATDPHETNSRPLETAADIHRQREERITTLLAQLLDPVLIDTADTER